MKLKVAIIGSFRRYYDEVLKTLRIFRDAGCEVVSPKGTLIRIKDVPFVRFISDPEDLSDARIQSLTLERIFTADFVYVLAPNGYVGRTTCYEIGCLLQARKVVYFSAAPCDLPIEVPLSHIAQPDEIVSIISGKGK